MSGPLTSWLALPAFTFRVALGLLFVRAAWAKARDLSAFADVVMNYRLLPDVLVRPVAASLVLAEFAVAALLLSGLIPLTAGLAAAALLLLFAAAMGVNILRGRTTISCGCLPGHAARPLLSWTGTLATASLVPLALLATQPWPTQPWQGAGILAMIQAALAGLLLFTLHDAALRLAATSHAGARS